MPPESRTDVAFGATGTAARCVVAVRFGARSSGAHAMDHAGVPHLGTDGATHDLLQIAAGYGVAATRSTTLDALEQQLGDALRDGRPAVIEYAETSA